ncbi:MAG: hypothetical protein EPO21_13850 [Chloroflexota bacterium]|nr:MAG: hypothetical protein EPO21_13850 [Chloroflexota bacterium]
MKTSITARKTTPRPMPTRMLPPEEVDPTSPVSRRLLGLMGATLILAVALWARLMTLDQVFTPAGIRFISGDAYLHLRRILITAQSYPVVPYADNYNGFPIGIEINWPPLWDFLVVTLAKLLGFGRPSEHMLLTVAAIFPVLVGLLVVLSLGLLARRLFGRGAEWPAWLIAALYPALQHPSLLGNVDHHSGVELSHVLLVMATIAVLSPSGDRRAPWLRQDGLPIVALAAAVAGALLVWMGAIYLIAFVPAFLALAWLVGGLSWQRPIWRAGIAFLLAALFLLPFARPGLTFINLSLFHTVALLGMGVVLIGLGLLGETYARTRRRRLLLVGVTGLVIAILSVPLAGRFWGVVIAGLVKAFGRYPWAQNTYEWQPLLFENGRVSFRRAVSAYGPSIFILPLALAVLALWHRRTGRLSQAQLFFYSWTAAAGVLASVTFMHYQLFGPSAVLLLAGATYHAYDLVSGYLSHRTAEPHYMRVLRVVSARCRSIIPAHRLTQTAAVSETAAVLFGRRATYRWSLALVLAVVSGWSVIGSRYQSEIPPGTYATLDWLRTHTPPTSGYDQITVQPEYGIMSPWGYGDIIAGAAQRPAVADGEHETNLRGFIASQQFFQSTEEDEALRIAKENNVRYVLVGRFFRVFQGDLSRFGPPTGMPGSSQVYAVDRMPDAQRNRMIYTRLFSWMRSPQIAPPQHFRLIHAGVEESAPPPNNLLIYEIVPGARLTGTANPGQEVVASLQLTVPGLGSGPLRFVTQADPTGRFDLVVPYSTTAPNYDARASAGYQVTSGTGKAIVAVSESAVQQGEQIAVEMTP